MTPQPNAGRAMARRRRLVRPVGLATAVALLVGGAPLVAHALDESTGPSTPSSKSPATVERQPVRRASATSALTTPGRDLAPDVAAADRSAELPTSDADDAEENLAEVVSILSEPYTVGDRGPHVAALQHLLGVTADGWYGRVTSRAHVAAAAEAGLLEGLAPLAVLPAGTTESEWAALRECESGGDYSITNPSGKYRGAYQFDRPTWNSVAERHDPTLVGVDPAAASPADQDAMARALYTERGARPWPHCGRHLS